jgi:hypothetical protein
MWYVAVLMCGLSGPAPCLIQAQEEPHAARVECLRARHALAALHHLPSGAIRGKPPSSGGAAARDVASNAYFNLGCIAYSAADAADGVTVEEKIIRTLGPKAGAEL